LQKGSKVLIEGKLQLRAFETKEGEKRKVTEVVGQYMEFLEAKKQEDKQPVDNQFGGQVFPEEEIPFN
jgi:single-strand DNA-binding protein